ncbi:MAG TPA: sigma-70 family RNA polymerase sigma factor [Terriglobales bacterium]
MEPKLSLSGDVAQVFEAHHALVFRTAYRITGNAADAEDVLQTIFLRLLRRQNADSVDSQESYLRRAAVNASLDLIRSRREDHPSEWEDIPSGGRDFDTGELRSALRRALRRLNPKSAEIFTLRFLEGFSNQEIARMLGISRVLVAVIVHRARGQLQHELRDYRQGGRDEKSGI